MGSPHPSAWGEVAAMCLPGSPSSLHPLPGWLLCMHAGDITPGPSLADPRFRGAQAGWGTLRLHPSFFLCFFYLF